jgi:hypothetical protein
MNEQAGDYPEDSLENKLLRALRPFSPPGQHTAENRGQDMTSNDPVTRFVLDESGLAGLAENYPVDDDHSALLMLETAIIGNGESSPPLITGPCELAIDLLANSSGEIDGYRVIIRPDDSDDAPWLASHICRVSYLEPLPEPDENGGLYDTAEIVRDAVQTANELLEWSQR